METDNRIFVVYRTTRTGLVEGSPDVYTDRAEALSEAESLAARRGIYGTVILQNGSRVASFGRLPNNWLAR
jgi:hypothetical protein